MSILVVVVEFFKPSAYYFSFFLIDKKNYGDRLEAVFRSSANTTHCEFPRYLYLENLL